MLGVLTCSFIFYFCQGGEGYFGIHDRIPIITMLYNTPEHFYI